MKHYELRLQHDLDAITARVEAVSLAVREAVDAATRAVISDDRDALHQVILADHPINREVRAIDAECHAFVARHMPSAGPLRMVSSVLRLNIALERVGDYAVTISRVGAHQSTSVPEGLREAIGDMADMSTRMLDRASRAFVRRDAALAREAIATAKRVDAAHDQLFDAVLESGASLPLRDTVGLITIIANLERVSDQAKNICEEALFAATGETKAPKTYKILFVDADDALLAPLAAALGRRAYPDSGRYFSAGVHPAVALAPELGRAADRLRLDLTGAMPRPLGPLQSGLADFHVVVALGREGEIPVVETPFHTIRLRWAVDPAELEGPDPADELARDLASRIRDLMETLRGPQAS
jgi:phosphate transport system protein